MTDIRLTDAERDARPGCSGCGHRCSIRGCQVCEGNLFCGKCEDEAREGDAFLSSAELEARRA